MSNIWFTADTHFGHANIIKYCNRPFENAHENDEILTANWNSVVQPDDRIYHLGDFGFGSKGYMNKILNRLMGQKFFIRGNHDKSIRGDVLNHWEFDVPYYELKVDDEEMDVKQLIVLCHYAFEVWNKKHWGSWHLHGHSHGTLPSSDSQARLDVGVDNNDYFPVSYEKVKEIMTRKVFKPVDHHGRK